jgi:hypothetical protein
MNIRYGRYGAAYNMIGFRCFNEELLLLPKNPTEAKLNNFRMNIRYGRYGAAYNMIGFGCFNEELLLLPKNPTEAKLQATSTRGESTEPT